MDYYTDAMTYTGVRVIDDFDKKMKGKIIVEHGEVHVARKVVGYKKIKFYTSENVGYGDVHLPEKEMHTTSYWFTVPWDLLNSLSLIRSDIIDGLAGLAYCLHHISAMLVMAIFAMSIGASATRAVNGTCAMGATTGSSPQARANPSVSWKTPMTRRSSSSMLIRVESASRKTCSTGTMS